MWGDNRKGVKLPDLLFCDDAWLGDYQYMVSTPEYYKVCSDVIRANDVNFPLTVAHCRQVISPERLKGFLMTHWCKTLPQNLDFILHAIDLTAQCMVI